MNTAAHVSWIKAAAGRPMAACLLIGLAGGLGVPSAAVAVNYTWAGGAGAVGYWTNTANWTPGGFPSSAGADNAFLTNNQAGASTCVLDTPVGAGTLALSNLLGQTGLILTNGSGAGVVLTNSSFYIGTGGRLEIDSGCVLSNNPATAFLWSGTNGTIVINNGGRLSVNLTTSFFTDSGVTSTVTSAGGWGNAGIWDNRGGVMSIGNTRTGSSWLVSNGVMLTNLGLQVQGFNNSVVLSSGASAKMTGSFLLGGGYSSNRIAITGAKSTIDCLGGNGYIDIGYNSGTGNVLSVSDGGLFTNATKRQSTVGGGYNSAGGTSVGNILIITNGGKVASGQDWYIGFNNNGATALATSNRAVVTAGGLWDLQGRTIQIGVERLGNRAASNWVQVDAGGVVTNANNITVGYMTDGTAGGAAVGNLLLVTNGGQVFVTTMNAGIVNTGVASNNSVLVTAGGLLEANTLAVNGVGAGNVIGSIGGVYQFATITPTITPNGAGTISLTDGSLSFRAVTNANVSANVAATVFTNIAWSGNNGFRLAAATNATTSSQSYVFEPGISPTNYARLEMVGGATCYRGQAGNSLSIGQNPGSSASMLCSNTAAVVTLPFTNNGTLRLANSTLTLATNATLNGTVVVDLGHLANAGTVLVAQRDLTLAGSSILAFTGTPTNNLTLMTYSGTRSGRFQITGLPSNYTVAYGPAQNGAVYLLATPPGTALLVR